MSSKFQLLTKGNFLQLKLHRGIFVLWIWGLMNQFLNGLMDQFQFELVVHKTKIPLHLQKVFNDTQVMKDAGLFQQEDFDKHE